ncbi:MAG: response regulator [Phycisphaerae bacterium]
MTGKSILVCDDEPHIVHVVATKLRNAGFDVVTAADGAEALDLATRQPPDLVITDYQMPLLSGLELCAKLRADPKLQNIPAIMLTARGFSLNDGDLQGTNIKRLLAKPFSPRGVLETVREVLQAAEPTSGETTGEPKTAELAGDPNA